MDHPMTIRAEAYHVRRWVRRDLFIQTVQRFNMMDLYEAFPKITILLRIIKAADSAFIPVDAYGCVPVLRFPLIFCCIVGYAFALLSCNDDAAHKIIFYGIWCVIGIFGALGLDILINQIQGKHKRMRVDQGNSFINPF